MEIQVTGFTSHDSALQLRFRYTNPRGVRVVVLETPYTVTLNGATLVAGAVPCPIVVEGEEPAYAPARASSEWDLEIKGTMRIDAALGENRVDFSETSGYAPLLAL